MSEIKIADSLVENDDTPAWLLTYADMMTLLLVFFVLLFTLAAFEKEHYESAVESIKVKIKDEARLIGLIELMEIPETADKMITIEDITGLRSREEAIMNDIQSFIKSSEAREDLATRILDGKIVVSINGKALFDSGSAALKTEAAPILEKMVHVLFDYPDYNINIKGHTDDIPIATEKFPSNWELSAIRATTVLRYLVQRGINPEVLTATGYGDSVPLVPNTSEENRAINRRVEFVLEKKTNPR